MLLSGQPSTTSERHLFSTIMHTVGCILVLCVISTSSSRMNGVQDNSLDVDALNDLLGHLDSHLANYQKRSCEVGIMNHNCQLEDLSRILASKAFLHSGYSPGKRSIPGVTMEGQGQMGQVPEDIIEEARALQDKVMEQRISISKLKRLLNSLTQSEPQEAQAMSPLRKRSCQFRLGGHCLTEELDRVASSYQFLRSPDSPGRRRRSTAGTISGEDVRTQETILAESTGSETVRR